MSEKSGEDQAFDIIGKICIVLMISRYENEKEFFFIRETKTSENHRFYNHLPSHVSIKRHWELRDGWYQYLWSKIYPVDDIRDALKHIVFISFNYDRSLEQFLYTSCINMLGMRPEDASDILNDSLKIHHVYGQIGYLEWQNKGTVKNPYERVSIDLLMKDLEPHMRLDMIRDSDLIRMDNTTKGIHHALYTQIISIAKEIKTYTEATDEVEAAEIEKTVAIYTMGATRLFCLGFGYHPQNMKWLGCTLKNCKCDIFGTGYGLGKVQQSRLKSKFKSILPDTKLSSFKPADLTIKEFFSQEMEMDL